MTTLPERPEGPSADKVTQDAMLRTQREANEQLVLFSVRAQEDLDQAEAARVSAEHDRAGLFEHAGWGVAIVGAQDTCLVAVNPAFAAMHGYSVEELIGRRLDTVCALPSRGQLTEDIRLLHEKGHHLFEGAHVRKDGSQFPCLTEATAIRDNDGQLTTSAYNFQDLSERTLLKARLAVADRLAALGTMSAGLAHEINNPLTYNLMNISHARAMFPVLLQDLRPLVREEDWLRQGIEQRGDGLLTALKEAQNGAVRIERIVAAMKTFAQPVAERFQAADLPRLLEAAILVCRDQIDARATLVQDFKKAPLVDCNEGELGQVFVNLLVNAAQAIAPGAPEGNQIRVRLDTDPSGEALIEIGDTGCGIALDALSAIYDPFFTTKPIGVGSGLGLSISHGIISAHGGRISVESVVGKGTVFRVHLPAAQSVTKPSEAVADKTPAAVVGAAKILIIDDEPNIGRALKRMLGRDHEIVVLTSAVDAMALLTSGAVFDVIFCDLMMDEMTGIEFYEWLVMNHPGQAERVLFITGGAINTKSREFVARMTDRVVLKPFERSGIEEMIQKVLKQHS